MRASRSSCKRARALAPLPLSSNCVRVDIDIDKKKKEKKEAEHVPVHVYVYYVCVCREKRIFGRGEPRFGACGYAARLVEKSLGRTRISGREITGRMSGNAASLFAGKCVKSPSTEPFFRRFFPHEKATIFRPIPLPPPQQESTDRATTFKRCSLIMENALLSNPLGERSTRR